jgi:hypothetical protein
MAISSLRWRAASAFIAAAAAAAAVLGLAAPAGASTGTAEISPEQAGYTAAGAQFQSLDARVFLRQPAQYAGQVGQYSHSVQLWSSGLVLTVGVTASTSGTGSYIPYAIIYNRGTHQMIASNPNAEWCDDSDNCGPTIGSIDSGETLIFNLSYNPKTGDVEFRALPGESNGGFLASYTADTGVSFTQARVGTEFGSTPWDGSYSHTPPAQFTKVGVFSDVGLTTYSGHTSTLWSWWVHHKLLANTGQQSAGDWVATATDLTSGGANFQTWFVPQNQQARTSRCCTDRPPAGP